MRRLSRDFEFFFESGVGCILFVIAFAVYIVFLAAADKAVKRCEPENRRIEPGMVWLALIPIFNLLWLIVIVERVGESIRNEFIARGRHKSSESYGKTAGLACALLLGIGVLFGLAETPCILVFWFFAFIYFIVYWVQLSGYARRLGADADTRFAPPPDEGW
ncbi:MAG: hypothetical protein U0791_10705 [Gemmataceae bacterium]